MRISSDGLVRLSIAELLATPMRHLVSGVDPEEEPRIDKCGVATTLTGYTEWVSIGEPMLSVGWDWCVQSEGFIPIWKRVGLPRSNIMIVDASGNDTGWARNLELLVTFVDALPWQSLTPEAIAVRYE